MVAFVSGVDFAAAVVRAVCIAPVLPAVCTDVLFVAFTHLPPGRLIAVAIISRVPESQNRTKMSLGVLQGAIVFAAVPAAKPNTMYAASELITCSVDADGTAKVMA